MPQGFSPDGSPKDSMITEKKRISTLPARSRKPTARPEKMRQYRSASAVSIYRVDGLRLGDSVGKAVESVIARRENGVRLQRQWIISVVAVIIMLALVAALYLNVTASASIAGRQIQNIEVAITANEQMNADLETKIASLLANSVLEARAQTLGFQPVERASLQYMVVPGYFPPQPVNMVPAAAPTTELLDAPEFKETLIDWISAQVEAASVPLPEATR